MRLCDVGEFRLIQRLTPLFSEGLPPQVIAGIGDDCSQVAESEERTLLVTTDMLVEGVHFLETTISADSLGWKALAVNLSDIAAMGGQPENCYLSLALPSHVALSWFDDFLGGFHRCVTRYSCPLLGGDLSRSLRDRMISVCVLGHGHPLRLKRRSGARIGDRVCVTGTLGNSVAGLQLLRTKASLFGHEEAEEKLKKAHREPCPPLLEGAWLGKEEAVHAMMDVSDGLASDIQRIGEQSQVSFVIDLDELPLSSALAEIAPAYGWDALTLALKGGEDYRLLCTVDSTSYDDVNARFQQAFGRPLWAVGHVVAQDRALTYVRGGHPVVPDVQGYDHFLSNYR